MRQQQKKKITKHILIPTLNFMQQGKSTGIVLGIFVAIALILANSPLREQYAEILHHKLGFIINGKPILYFTLEHWINDGLMSMFFFVVGLELKREFIGGELQDLRKVTMPVVAAILGMAVPAAIYLLLNNNSAGENGWGIPMATDIAFALAVVYALGDRVPMTAKVFLTTMAIVDDIGAVVVIALFYTSHISVLNIAVGVTVLMIMMIANRMGVKNIWFYGLLGIGGVWRAFLISGIHATIAAVLSAMVIPADSDITENAFIARMKKLTRKFEKAEQNNVDILEPQQVEIISRIKYDSTNATPPLQRLEHSMHPLVSFIVMPIFALANSGVSFIDMQPAVIMQNNIAIGVICGLIFGKPIGVVAAVWLTEKMGIGRRSKTMTWRVVVGIGLLASIGFTMSMFVTMLAFDNNDNYTQAKVGIFAASIIGAVAGYCILRRKA